MLTDNLNGTGSPDEPESVWYYADYI
jgi:hypothetical protein